MVDISKTLMDVVSFIGLIPTLIAILTFQRHNRTQRRLAWLVWGSTVISLTAFVLAAVFHRPNLFLLHILTIFELIFLTLIYQDYLPRKMDRIIIVVFSLGALFNSIVVEQFASMNVPARSMEALIIIVYALLFFSTTLRQMEIKHLERIPLFWISSGGLIYYSGSFLIFLFSVNIRDFGELWFGYWGLHALFNILLNLIYAVALWVKPTR